MVIRRLVSFGLISVGDSYGYIMGRVVRYLGYGYGYFAVYAGGSGRSGRWCLGRSGRCCLERRRDAMRDEG